MNQEHFDLTIGRLDRMLSELVNYGRMAKKRDSALAAALMDKPNCQTLKHHAEDMIAAGQKILRDLGEGVEGTPQPSYGKTHPNDLAVT